MDRDSAIRNTHPTVVTIQSEGDTWNAWDNNGDVVVNVYLAVNTINYQTRLN